MKKVYKAAQREKNCPEYTSQGQERGGPYQLNRWKEHFQEILNRSEPRNMQDLTEGRALAMRTGKITMAEIKMALKNIKNGKSAGCVNIPQKPGRKEDWFGQGPPFSLEQDLDCGGHSSGLVVRSPGQPSQER